MNANGHLSYFLGILLMATLITACTSRKAAKHTDRLTEVITSNSDKEGYPIHVVFRKGIEHNHPLMAIWVEDASGNYIETLYVARSIGTGIFGHGRIEDGQWEPGPVSRPAALPYWWHKYGELPAPESPVPDAITGPTPEADFYLDTRIIESIQDTFKVLLEINQSWDWNEFWTNDLYPGNIDYETSSQPALVYEVLVDRSGSDQVFLMTLSGHSHYAGENGKLYKDLSTITSAKNITGSIKVIIPQSETDN